MWESWESSESMENWDNVILWEKNMEGCTDEKVGRVKYARFYMFGTKEGIPFEVKYLTAADELIFYSNTNSNRLNLSTGEYLSELTQLKRLTISAYGLTELDPSFKNLKNSSSSTCRATTSSRFLRSSPRRTSRTCMP